MDFCCGFTKEEIAASFKHLIEKVIESRDNILIDNTQRGQKIQ